MDQIVSKSAEVSEDWSMKDAICKGVAFRNAQNRMDLDNLTYREQLEYFQRRKFAVPMYIISKRTDFHPFYEVTKKEFDRIALPEKVVPWTKRSCYRLDYPFAWINRNYSAVSNWPYGKDDFVGALSSFANDARKMSLYILHYAGYLNTANWHWRKKVAVQKRECGLTVTVSLEDPVSSEKERFVFEFGCTRIPTGYDDCHLHSLLREMDDTSEQILSPGVHTVVFDKMIVNHNCNNADSLNY